MGAGEGGIIVTDDDRMAHFCRSMCNQGRGEARVWLSHERLGYNYRMDDPSAALGVAQVLRTEGMGADETGYVAEVLERALGEA